MSIRLHSCLWTIPATTQVIWWVTSESNQVCQRRLIYSQVQSPVLLVTLYSCLGHVVPPIAPMLELLPCPHHVEPFSRIMYAAMLSALHCANGAIATGTIFVATRQFQEIGNRVFVVLFLARGLASQYVCTTSSLGTTKLG